MENELSNTQLEELSESLGFEGYRSYSSFIDSQNEILLSLERDCNLSSLDDKVLYDYSLYAFNIVDTSISARISLSDACNCNRINNNCSIQVAAISTTMHGACLAVAD